MSLKEDALRIASDQIFNNGQTHRVVFCNGTWSETTATKQEIFSTELSSSVRPEISYISATYDQTTNSLVVLLQNNAYVAPATLTFNRVAIVSDGKELASFPILSIAGNVVTLNGTPTDWVIGETVYTETGEFVITNISTNQITLDNPPTATDTVLVNGTGSLAVAVEIDSKTFSASTTNQLEIEAILSGN